MQWSEIVGGDIVVPPEDFKALARLVQAVEGAVRHPARLPAARQ